MYIMVRKVATTVLKNQKTITPTLIQNGTDQTKTYTATLPKTVNGQKVYGWVDYDNGKLKLAKPETISHYYKDGGSFQELYLIVKAESWLKSNQNWYYQKQGQLVQNSWIKDQGSWYFMDDEGVMFNQTWLYQGGSWYAFSHQEP